jgi:hypothetical protein
MKGPGPKNNEIKHIRKLTFNINGLTIYFVLAIPLNENFNALKALGSKVMNGVPLIHDLQVEHMTEGLKTH